jgi:hypothetical protein
LFAGAATATATATATARLRGERKRSLQEKRKRHVVAVAGRDLVPDSDTSRERMATALAAPGVRRTLASARLTTAGRVGRRYLCVVSLPLFPPLIFGHLVAGDKKNMDAWYSRHASQPRRHGCQDLNDVQRLHPHLHLNTDTPSNADTADAAVNRLHAQNTHSNVTRRAASTPTSTSTSTRSTHA